MFFVFFLFFFFLSSTEMHFNTAILSTSSYNPWDGIFPAGLPYEKFGDACCLA